MKLKLIFTAILIAISAASFAQREEISGRVINRTTGNAPIAGARVQVSNNVDRHIATTDESGQFTISNLYAGTWRVVVSAENFGNYEAPITLQPGATLNLGNIFMFPAIAGADELSSELGMLEGESSDHQQSGPALLSSQQDVFSSIANFRFGEMRFRARGYDWNLQRTYLNGLLMNDANTGNSPFSLWGGLNDVMRNQETSSGMQPRSFAAGNVAGMNNFSTRASQIRKGFQINYASSGGNYAHRLGVAWTDEVAKNLFLSVMGSARYTPADYALSWTTGTYVQGFSYFLGLEKKFSLHESLSFTVLGAPVQRAVSGAAVQEVYNILDDPYYNPNWGYQDGKIRSARIRNSHEPIMTLDYTNRISNRLRIQAAANYRFGKNGYTALDWYDAPDPRPDYYRYLPSFFTDPIKATEVRRAWIRDENVRHINWDQLYNVNYSNIDENFDSQKTRSKYAVQNRRADQHDINLGTTVNALVNDFLKIDGGLAYRWNRTEYFNEMLDLLGGGYWVDVDGFAERDFPQGDEIQNDLRNPNRIIKKGDKYGHNYYAFTQTGRVWAIANFTMGSLAGYVGGDFGFTTFYRDGLFEKGLFPNTPENIKNNNHSFGKSEVFNFLTYAVQAGGNYRVTGNHIVGANFNYNQQAPYFRDAFISPRTRNSTVDNLVPEKILAADVSYDTRIENMKFRVAGFFTTITDRSRVMSFYDDYYRAMSNFALSGVDQRHLGVEFGADVYVWNGFSVKSAVAYGDYQYTSNPRLTQTVDNSNEILMTNERVRWNGYYVSGTPQLAANLGVEYRAPRNWWAGMDLNYYDFSYIDMNPLRRTNAILNEAENPRQMRRQEKFTPGFTLNANFGRWTTINRKYSLGIMLTVSNILNNQKLQSGGFEQSRLSREIDDDGLRVDRYSPFPSKYYYLNGTSYFLNVFFRF
jgi:hypothetical protein